jgi:hypothetical protein
MVKTLTDQEHLEYLDKLYGRLLENRYRYYVLDDNVISDFEYDFIERSYNEMAQKAGVKLMEMVDFDPNDPLAIEAKNRVDSGTDSHSLWVKSMEPIWEQIGRTKKQEKERKDV